MTTLQTRASVGSDGNVVIPVGKQEAGTEVFVTITPAPPRLSQKEWEDIVNGTAGSIDDPTFFRHPQGDYEKREELE